MHSNNVGKRTLPWLLTHSASKVAAIALTLMASSISAWATNLVVNGSFEQLLAPGVSSEFGGRYPSQQVLGWTTDGYNFVFTPGSADTTFAVGEYGTLALWGPGTGANNGLTPTSPDGGNFLGMDGAFGQAPILQTIHGLTPGKATAVSFWFAGAQQAGFNGPTTEQFQVSLGFATQFTPVLSNASHGFTGWQHEVLTFIPTASSEVLSFLAVGTPAGVPPFSLLDGVTIDGAPEPATWTLAAVSILLVGGLAWVRRKRSAIAQSQTKAK